MEAAVVAASAAAAAAKEAALAASVAAADAAKDAALAAATAKEAAVAASAAALYAKEAAAVASAAGEAAATAAAAAMRAAKERKFHLIDDDQDPPGSGNIDDGGSIGLLPDAVLGSIVSLLPTKEGVRTQAISRRWRPLWRSAPLNLVVDNALMSKGRNTVDLITKILAEHPGPARRFLLCTYISDCYDKIEHWLSSRALDNLHELELNYNPFYGYREKQLYLLPSSAYRFAPTLRVAKFSGCHFPDLIVQLSLKFPCLKQLTLESVTISEDALQSIFSGSPTLESLELKKNFGIGRLCISSQTLQSIGFCAGSRKESVLLQELVVEDAPCLERLLPLDPQFGPATIRKMIAISLTTKMHTVRVLVLDLAGPNLDIVVNFLKCFPCLERLYVIFQSGMGMDNIRKYDPLDPIECLELHLKEVVLKNYDGTIRSYIDFAKFFVLNAKVLKEMKIKLHHHRQHNWFPKQHRLLRIENRASRDARIELTCGIRGDLTHNRHTHDLSMADPFDMPSGGRFSCS